MNETHDPERRCIHCGEVVRRPRGEALADFARRISCGLECRRLHRPDILHDYLVSAMSGCWEWQGHLDRNGYGKAYDEDAPDGRRRHDWAHRVSYRLHKGEIPPRYEVDHICQNPRCINPEHLEAVTKGEHVRRTNERGGKDDRHARAAELRQRGLTFAQIAAALGYSGRAAAQLAVQSALRKSIVRPDALPPARRLLTPTDRASVRALYASGVSQQSIGGTFGIHPSHVSRICSGRSSGHVSGAAT